MLPKDLLNDLESGNRVSEFLNKYDTTTQTQQAITFPHWGQMLGVAVSNTI